MSIRLRSRRGPIGEGWHAVALRTLFDGMLGRQKAATGRRIARADRVQWIDVEPGLVRGAVEDDLGGVMEAELLITTIRADDRPVILEVASRHPDLPLRLASGEYPHLVEKELEANECPILPQSLVHVNHNCSCDRWPGPCQHVAALMIVVVEAVDSDPMLLLRMRGIDLEDLAGSAVAASAAATRSAPAQTVDPAPVEDPAAPAIGSDLDRTEDDAGIGGAETPEDAEEPPSATFDPLIADPSLLEETLGGDVAAVLAAFYRHERPSGTSAGARPPGPGEHPSETDERPSEADGQRAGTDGERGGTDERGSETDGERGDGS